MGEYAVGGCATIYGDLKSVVLVSLHRDKSDVFRDHGAAEGSGVCVPLVGSSCKIGVIMPTSRSARSLWEM